MSQKKNPKRILENIAFGEQIMIFLIATLLGKKFMNTPPLLMFLGNFAIRSENR